MCGRYAFTRDTEAVREHYDIPGRIPRVEPQAEIFPTNTAPVVALKGDGVRSVGLVKWGVKVPWQTQPLINARSESAAFKPTFRKLFQRQRCLIPATSFFEWRKEGRKKVRNRITFPGRDIVSFAGLWDVAVDGKPWFVILTTEANAAVAPVHDRMPVVVRPVEYARWLDWDTPVPQLLDMARALPATETALSEVSNDPTPSLF